MVTGYGLIMIMACWNRYAEKHEWVISAHCLQMSNTHGVL